MESDFISLARFPGGYVAVSCWFSARRTFCGAHRQRSGGPTLFTRTALQDTARLEIVLKVAFTCTFWTAWTTWTTSLSSGKLVYKIGEAGRRNECRMRIALVGGRPWTSVANDDDKRGWRNRPKDANRSRCLRRAYVCGRDATARVGPFGINH